MLSSLTVKLVLAGSVLVAVTTGSGYAGWKMARAACLEAEADRRALADAIREENAKHADTVAMMTADAIAGIRVTNKTITQEIRHEREVHRVLESVECAAPASSVRLLNRARGYHGDAGPRADQPAAGVPSAGEAEGADAAR